MSEVAEQGLIFVGLCCFFLPFVVCFSHLACYLPSFLSRSIKTILNDTQIFTQASVLLKLNLQLMSF